MSVPAENRPSLIQVLLLDVGGVIVPEPDPGHLAAIGRQLDLPDGVPRPLLYEGDGWVGISTGQLEEDEYWRLVAGRIGRPPLTLHVLLAPIWRSSTADPAVLDLMRATRSRVQVAILSNDTLGFEARLQAMGVADLADPIINSAQLGLRKPDPQIYRSALAILDVPAAAVLFVDDKPRNTLVARELGIECVDFTSAADMATTLRRYGLLPD